MLCHCMYVARHNSQNGSWVVVACGIIQAIFAKTRKFRIVGTECQKKSKVKLSRPSLPGACWFFPLIFSKLRHSNFSDCVHTNHPNSLQLFVFPHLLLSLSLLSLSSIFLPVDSPFRSQQAKTTQQERRRKSQALQEKRKREIFGFRLLRPPRQKVVSLQSNGFIRLCLWLDFLGKDKTLKCVQCGVRKSAEFSISFVFRHIFFTAVEIFSIAVLN